MVFIKHLTYKGYRSGDIPVIWGNIGTYSIYDKYDRDDAEKRLGSKGKDMDKKFFDLCTDFGLTKEGEIIPKDVVV